MLFRSARTVLSGQRRLTTARFLRPALNTRGVPSSMISTYWAVCSSNSKTSSSDGRSQDNCSFKESPSTQAKIAAHPGLLTQRGDLIEDIHQGVIGVGKDPVGLFVDLPVGGIGLVAILDGQELADHIEVFELTHAHASDN